MNDVDPSLDILLVEDSAGDAKLIEHHLRSPNVDAFTESVFLTRSHTLGEGLSELESGAYDLLFLDLNLPDSSGLDTLEEMLAADSNLPVVVLTVLENHDMAVEAIQRGAQDYLPKSRLDAESLARSLRYAVERHRQEQELRRQNERLERFASMVSHDLLSPLTAAQNRMTLAQETGESKHIESAVDALRRIEAIVEDLLALALQGQRVEETTPVQLSDVANRCWKMIDTGSAELRLEQDATFLASADRLQELLENLFRNAIQHGPDGVTIRVGAVDEPHGFFVADDGPGIREEMTEKIFEFGYSTDDTGTGIGLTIVQEIAEAHDWICKVAESKEGGARFDVLGLKQRS